MFRTNTLYDLETTAKFWLLNLRGVKVPIDRDLTAAAIDWCDANCKGGWAWHHLPELIDTRNLVRNLDTHFHGECSMTPEYVEDSLINALAQEMNNEIDQEILMRLGVKPQNYFWFDAKDDAVRFKLSW